MSQKTVRDELPGKWVFYSNDVEFVRTARLEANRIRRKISGAPIEKRHVGGKLQPGYKRAIRLRRQRRRHGKNIARKFIAWVRGPRRFKERDVRKTFSYRSSPLLDALVPGRAKKFKSSAFARANKKVVAVPLENLSFTHNPNETLNQIASLVERDCDSLGAYIDFKDTHCLDIGPYLLLMTIKAELQLRFDGGTIKEAMTKVLNALGLDLAMRMVVPRLTDGHRNVHAFPIATRRRSGSSISNDRYLNVQTFEKIARQLADEIDKWLEIAADQHLTKHGRRIVLKLVTETLNNAERHGDLVDNEDDGDWVVAGFMAQREIDKVEVARCHLAFMSTGTTVAETIGTAPEPTAGKMRDYIKKHRRSFVARDFSEEQLKTVFAIQDGVTRSAKATKEERNGTGFQDILEFYADLAGDGSGDADASLAILSGKTCILCNSTYMKGRKQAGEDSERELWFNDQNTSDLPPQPNNVVALDRSFRGTLISMAFNLDPEYLERTV